MKWNLTKEKRRSLLFLPLVVLPFCCLVFHVLGGGRGVAKGAMGLGLNTNLPAVPVDWQKAFQDKLKTYEQADKDSVRRGQYQRQDPYHRDSLTAGARGAAPFPDPRAEQLERRLAALRQVVQPPAPVYRSAALTSAKEGAPVVVPAPDPQIERLNVLLDKVIRIQHPQETAPVASVAPGRVVDEVLPADPSVNSIAAIIPEDQILVAGATITLRIMDSIRVAGRVVPAGELVYGTVTLNNDRLLVHVGSLREDRNLYPTDWQVYDLDGLPGIHIPGVWVGMSPSSRRIRG